MGLSLLGLTHEPHGVGAPGPARWSYDHEPLPAGQRPAAARTHRLRPVDVEGDRVSPGQSAGGDRRVRVHGVPRRRGRRALRHRDRTAVARAGTSGRARSRAGRARPGAEHARGTDRGAEPDGAEPSGPGLLHLAVGGAEGPGGLADVAVFVHPAAVGRGDVRRDAGEPVRPLARAPLPGAWADERGPGDGAGAAVALRRAGASATSPAASTPPSSPTAASTPRSPPSPPAAPSP